VVGRASEVARKNLANSVATVNTEALTRTPVATLDQAVQGKVAGANIQSNSGAPGGGMQMRLRGVSTINGESAPLYVVDGIIVSDVAIASGISAVTGSREGSNTDPTQDNQVNRIADLNPYDIESVEVLKGPSAAAIYGSKAANGVIIITTKRGRQDDPLATVAQRVGFYQLSNKLGARRFADVEEAVAAFGPQARDHFQPGVSYDHEQQLAGRMAPSFETSASVSGNTGGVRYFFSALNKDDKGTIANTGYQKQSIRANVSRDFGDRVELSTTLNVIHTVARRGLTNNDNRGLTYYMVFPFTPSFLDLRPNPDGTYPVNPFIGSRVNPLQTAALVSNDEDVWRALGSVDLTINAYKTEEQELKIAGNIGLDRFQQKNTVLLPPELHFLPDVGGTYLFGTSENLNFNTGINLVHTYRPKSRLLNATTSAGFQHEEQNLSVLNMVGQGLIAGQPSVNAALRLSGEQRRLQTIDRGYYLQEEVVTLEDRLTLVGSLRSEHSSVNGNPYQQFFYPKAAAAYRFTQLPFQVNELKARLAYGETGNRPLYGNKFTPLLPGNIEGQPGIVVGGIAGDPTIRPERQREIEAGVDMIAWDGRAILELTVYQQTVSNMVLKRQVAPSTGFLTELFNGGEIQNRGFEATLQLTPVRTAGITWDSRTTFALNRSLITSLPVPAFNVGGFGNGLGAFRLEQGASPTQIVGNDGLREDGTCCVVRKLGDTEPAFRVGFSNTVTYGGFTLSALLDWQQGSKVINLTRFLYDLGSNTPDFATAGRERLERQATSAAVYIEDASFLKLRELTLTYDLPGSWFNGSLGPIRSVRLALSGRNLLTFTGYSGLDPEVSNFGNQPISRNIDVAPYPPSRTFWGSVEVGF
ncbi:MAG TPA: SusC/RagA family TonB-linked outer membrane protein, partial [Myxococcaceae bacterium]|nr:SusC/RagA family TonB-linked outer membrane protein [Myxococcaceae bacterium]